MIICKIEIGSTKNTMFVNINLNLTMFASRIVPITLSILFSVAYIKSVDGTAGCFRGVSAKLCANVVNGAAFETVREGIHFESDFKSFVDEEELDPHVERYTIASV